MSKPIGHTPRQNQFTRAVVDDWRGSVIATSDSTLTGGLGTARAFYPTEKYSRKRLLTSPGLNPP